MLSVAPVRGRRSARRFRGLHAHRRRRPLSDRFRRRQPRGAESVRRTIYQLRQRHPAADRQFLQLRGPWPHLHARLGLSLLLMKLLDTLHRWTGGLIGLLLALMGPSGTILLYEHRWTFGRASCRAKVLSDVLMWGWDVALKK